jgi:hypothetical protein
MPNKIPDNPDERNEATQKSRSPQSKEAQKRNKNEHTGMSESGVIARSPEREIVDQEPGESQKRNQGDEKDDPLAA